jgi:hypothetical protein
MTFLNSHAKLLSSLSSIFYFSKLRSENACELIDQIVWNQIRWAEAYNFNTCKPNKNQYVVKMRRKLEEVGERMKEKSDDC